MNSLPRLRLARETRLLLATVLLSAATLLLLARFRFPDAPAPVIPREQPLERLAAEALFDELSATIARARSRLAPFVPVLQVERTAASREGEAAPAGILSWLPALRFREDLAVAAVGPGERLRVLDDNGTDEAALVAHDPVRGFGVVRLQGLPPLAGPPPLDLVPPTAMSAGYAVAIEAGPGGLAPHPVFVDRFYALPTPLWSSARALPPSLRPAGRGTIVSDLDGRLLGVLLGSRQPALVPASDLVAAAERLLSSGPPVPASLGAEILDVDPLLAQATGAPRGAIVTHVDPAGPAAGVLRVGDVIVAVEGEAVASAYDVNERVRANEPGTTLLLGVRRGGEERALQVTLAAAKRGGSAEQAASGPGPRQLGLTLSLEPGGGSRVRQVAPGSASARAGLSAGDLITWIAGEDEPTPAQVRSAFASAAPGGRLLVCAARNGSHAMLVVEKR